jgi:soluble lytic murein transglycosylase
MDWIEKQKRWLFLIILLGAAAWFFERWQYRREHSQDKVILEAATHYGMDPALVKAVVWRESRFNPRVKGRAGEIGLMQLRKTASEEWAAAEKISLFSHQQLYDPGKNTLAGTWYLRKLLARYSRTDNPLPYALADYNAGRSHVLKWNQGAASTNSAAFIERIDFPSTKDYVKEVMKRYQHYRPIFPERKEKERLAMTRIENGQGFCRTASF